MMRLIVKWLICAIAVAVAVWIVPGVGFDSADATLSVILLAAVLSLLNSFIKPVLQVISIPITIITLGIFALVVNTAVLYLAAWIGNGLFGTGFYITGFINALAASVIISIVTSILDAITGANSRSSSDRR
jgi:putative membrane protein